MFCCLFLSKKWLIYHQIRTWYIHLYTQVGLSTDVSAGLRFNSHKSWELLGPGRGFTIQNLAGSQAVHCQLTWKKIPLCKHVTANKGSYENTSFSLNRSHADFVSWPLSSAFLFHSPNRRKMTKERRFLWAWGQAVSLRKGSCAEEMARTCLKGSHASWSLKSQKHSGGADRPWV